MVNHPGKSSVPRPNALLRSLISCFGQLKAGRHRQSVRYFTKTVSGYRRRLQSIASLLSGVSLTVGALAQENPDPNNLAGSDKEPVGKFIQPVAPPALDLSKTIDLHVD